MAASADRWSRWLLERRDAGDERQRQVVLEHLEVVREGVLALAEPLDGATVLDVGTGDGLIGLAALERVGPTGHVIFSDVSEALLEHARDAAGRTSAPGSSWRAPRTSRRFPTPRSTPPPAVGADLRRRQARRVARAAPRAASGRADLAVRADQPADVPRAGGPAVGLRRQRDRRARRQGQGELRRAGGPGRRDDDGLRDRDLVRLAEEAGFERIHLECHIDVEPAARLRALDLEKLLDIAPNPLAPTLREAVDAALSAPERARFLARYGQTVAEGQPLRRSAVAYLAAAKHA